ncbi:MAG: hypothetical protein ACK55Z_26965, partial [bacterium]
YRHVMASNFTPPNFFLTWPVLSYLAVTTATMDLESEWKEFTPSSPSPPREFSPLHGEIKRRRP